MSETSHNENREVLLERARVAGVRNAHVCSDETLEKKVLEAEKKNATERFVAPKLEIVNKTGNTREQKAREIEAKYPGTKCVFKRSGTSPEKLRGLHNTGETYKNSIICVTDAEGFDEMLNERNKGHRETMDSIDSLGTKIKSLDASAKTPVQKEKD